MKKGGVAKLPTLSTPPNCPSHLEHLYYRLFPTINQGVPQKTERHQWKSPNRTPATILTSSTT